MKCLLLIPLLLAVAAARNGPGSSSGCRYHRRVYSYETQVVNGMIPNTHLRNGLKLAATAVFLWDCNQNVLVNFTDIQFFRIDQSFQNADELMIHSESLKDMVGEGQYQSLIESLQVPFGFKYTEKGMVSKLLFDDKDWTINIKKGFITLFQINLDKILMFPGQDYERDSKIRQYTVLEASPIGWCATRYFYKAFNQLSQEAIAIDKVRDYSRCVRTRKSKSLPPWEGTEMPSNVRTEPMSHGNNLKYLLTGNDLDFKIASVVGEERIVFSPNYDPHQKEEIRATVNQTLNLYKDDTIMYDEPLRPEEFIHMSPENKALQQDRHLTVQVLHTGKLAQAPLISTADKIVTELRLIAQNVENIASRESLTHLRVVTDMVRDATYDTIQTAFVTLKKSPKDKKAFDMMWMVAAHAGSKKSTRFVLDVCSRDTTVLSYCKQALIKLSLSALPSTDIIDKMLAMTTNTALTQDADMKMSIYLTLGSLAHKLHHVQEKRVQKLELENLILIQLMGEPNPDANNMISKWYYDNLQEVKETIETSKTECQKVLTALKSLLARDDVKDKTLALKAFKNAGLTEAVPVLKEYLISPEIKTSLPYTRILAVQAFSRLHIHSTMRIDALNFLFNITLNPAEANEMRTTAFTVLMALKPDLPLIEMIVARIPMELDLHFSSYVLSYLEAYANSTFEPVQPLSKLSADALTAAPEYKTGILHSFYKYKGFYDEKHRSGVAFQLASIGSIDRYMSWDFGVDTAIFGAYKSPLSINVATVGAANVIKNFFENKLGKAAGKPLQDILKNPAILQSKQVIKEITSMLAMTPREQNTFYGQVSLTMFGHEIKYFETLKELMEFFVPEGVITLTEVTGGVKAKQDINIATAMYLSDSRLTMLTEIGLPVTVQAQVAFTQKMAGAISLTTNGYLQQATFSKDLNAKVVVGMHATVGLDWFGIKPAVGFHGMVKFDSPVYAETTVTYDMKQASFTIAPPRQDKPVIDSVMEPLTEFLTIFNHTSMPTMDVITRPITNANADRIIPIAVKIPLTCFGMELEVNGQTPVNKFYPFTASPLAGRVEFTLSMPTSPKTIRVDFIIPPVLPKAAPSKQDKDAYLNSGKFNPKAVTVPMMVNKALSAANLPLPKAVNPLNKGFIIMIDASSEGVTRTTNIELVTVFGKDVHDYLLTVTQSRLPAITQPWRAMVHYQVQFPRVYYPEDLYNMDWQQMIHEDMEFYIWRDTSRTENAISMTTNTETANQESFRVPSSTRVVDSFVPELVFSSGHDTQAVVRRTLVAHNEIEAEFQMNVDPYFRNRDNEVYQCDKDLKDVMNDLVQYLDLVLKNDSYLPLDNLVNINYVIMKQQHSLAMLFDIFNKYTASETISIGQQIEKDLKTMAKTFVDILGKMEEIYKTKGLGYSLPNGGPIAVFPPLSATIEASTECFNIVINANTTQDDILRYIQCYWLEQTQVIKSVQQVMNDGGRVTDFSKVYSAVEISMNVTKAIDASMYRLDMFKAPGPRFVVVATTQVEVMKNLWQSYMKMVSLAKDRITFKPTEKSNLAMMKVDSLLKALGSLFSMRTSLVAKAERVDKAIGFETTAELKKIREQMLWVEVDMMVQYAFLLNPGMNALSIDWTSRIEHIFYKVDFCTAMVTSAINRLHKLSGRPNGYQIVSIYDAIQRTWQVAGLTRNKIASLTSNNRVIWISEVEKKQQVLSHVKAALKSLFQNPGAPVPLNFVEDFISAAAIRNMNDAEIRGYTDVPTEKVVKVLDQLIGDYNELLNGITSNPEEVTRFMKDFAGKVELLIKDIKKIMNDPKFQVAVPAEITERLEKIRAVQVKVIEAVRDIIVENMSDVNEKEIAANMATIGKAMISMERIILSIIHGKKPALFSEMPHHGHHAPHGGYSDEATDKVVKVLDQIIGDFSELLTDIESNPEEVIHIMTEFVKKVNDVIVRIRMDPRIHINIPAAIMERLQKIKGLEIKLAEAIKEIIEDNLSDATEKEIGAEVIAIGKAMMSLKELIVSMFNGKFSDAIISGQVRTPYGIFAKLNISWGELETVPASLQIDIGCYRSVEDTLWIMKQLDPAAMSQDVINTVEKRMTLQPVRNDMMMDRLNTYNHIQTTIRFSLMPLWVRQSGYILKESMQASLWSFHTESSLDVAVAGSKGRIEASIHLANDKMDVAVSAIGQKDVFSRIPLSPVVMRSIKPTQVVSSLSTKVAGYASGGYDPAVCSISGAEVFTFDRVSYMLPSVTKRCHSVVAMDCGPNPAFVVKRNFEKKSGAIIFEIATQLKTIEVIPGINGAAHQVKIDGQIVKQALDIPVVHHLGYIITIKSCCVEISLPLLGVYVNVRAGGADVEVSQIFKNQLCGLCGNFDGQKNWEFEGPKEEIYMNRTAFALSYVLPNNNCPASLKKDIKPWDIFSIPKPGHPIDYNTILGPADAATGFFVNNAEDACTVERHTMIKVFKKKNLVCFSSQPITECSFDCDGEQATVERKKIAFHCFGKKQLQTRSLMRAIRKNGKVLNVEDLKDHSRIMYRKVSIENNCRA